MFGFESHENDNGATIESAIRRSAEITKEYGKELPPPNPDLAVVAIVPAYNELDNDNFWRMVRSASAQDTSKSNFEILYVVNERKTRLGRIKYAIKPSENLRTVRILEALEECEGVGKTEKGAAVSPAKLESLGLSGWEQSLFREAVRRNVSIYPLFFKHNQEVGPGRKFFPQGMARDIGAAVALERLNKLGKLDESIIDFVDADCFFPADYFSRLQKHIADPYVRKILMPVSPDIPESVEKIKDPSWRLAQVIKYLRFSFIKARHRYLAADTTTVINSGPALAVQAKTFAKVGSYPTITSMFSGEDIEFAEGVRRASRNENTEPKQEESSSVMLYLSQRQADTSTDGAIYAELSRDQKPSNLEDEYQAIRTNKFFERLTNLQGMLRDALERNMIASQDPRYLSLRAQWFKREKTRKGASLRVFQGILEKMRGDFDVPKALNRLNPRQRDYLESQPAISRSLSEIFKLVKRARQNSAQADFYLGEPQPTELSDNDLAIKFLQRFLPEYFNNSDENEPDYEKLRISINQPQEPNSYNLGWFSHLTLALAEYSQYPNSKLALKT
ncbi:MAG: hypothetical protein HY978_01215 [Candidatus Liptonbacteria bacterium]|nr:hypothetical protein [Candidatus Liptonbacteria bacterium]